MLRLLFAALAASLVGAQQQCYYGPGAEHRAPAEAQLVPCLDSGTSACCRLGDTCLSGNTCYDYTTGDLYQYGCTDVTYQDESCPFKCGFNSTKSPWTALEWCGGVQGVEDTWVCHAPESCGCQWEPSWDLLVLAPRGCAAMGDKARVALYAPSAIAPYVSLPSSYGGQTSYYSGTTISGTSTWVSTALEGYTPAVVKPLTTYATPAPTKIVQLFPNESPGPSSLAAAVSVNATVTPEPNGVWSGGSSSSTSSSATTTKPSVKTITAAPTSINAHNPSLSTGAKAGIGVGVAVAAIAVIAALAFFCLRRRRRASAKHAQDTADSSNQGPGLSEKSPAWQGSPAPPYDYHGVPTLVHEADSGAMMDEERAKRARASVPPMELDGNGGRVEMAGNEVVGSEMESPPLRGWDRDAGMTRTG